MIIFYSGYGCKLSDPEVLFKEQGNVMLTAVDSLGKRRPERRFRRLIKARKHRVSSCTSSTRSGATAPSRSI